MIYPKTGQTRIARACSKTLFKPAPSLYKRLHLFDKKYGAKHTMVDDIYDLMPPTPAPTADDHGGTTRRDFLYLTAGALGAGGAAALAWAMVDTMNPSADTLALSSIEVDLTPIAKGQAITVSWRGKPVFVRSRTPQEISEAADVKLADLPDPQTDQERVKHPEWLIVVGICTHLGCIPLGQKTTDPRGKWGGYLCPCHGSQYDTSGRIRQGPAPKNLEVPAYTYLTDSRVKIG